jgi:hypothetical protein
MDTEALIAREDAIANLDGSAPMALEQAPPRRSGRLTEAEKAARAAARAIERERAKLERGLRKAREREEARLARIAEAEGGHVELPAIVLRDGTVSHLPLEDFAAVITPCLGALSADVENSGYDLGHELYELRTIQLGGEHLAVVLDAADPVQLGIAAWALRSATRLHAYSAVVEAVNSVLAGLIGWEEFWGKMRDGVLYAKLIDPKLSGSEADGLKDLARDLLGEHAVSSRAEKAKNALFAAMGCLVQANSATPPERNGWNMVRKDAVTMIRYAGSDVLDLGAVVRVLEPQVPVSEEVLARETRFQMGCARVALDGFALDEAHIDVKIAEFEAKRAVAQFQAETLTGGVIVNPSAPGVAACLTALDPSVELPPSAVTGDPSAAKKALEPLTRRKDIIGAIARAVLEYRHCVTTLGLLLRPLKALCANGDGRMRPTVYTIEAVTGRTSCRRPNGQQFSRQGGVRACVRADEETEGIGGDFQGCEIRVAAALAGDKALLEAEVSTRCWACGHDPCDCGKDHKGLHWMAAHFAFGKEAVKEHRYWCKRGVFCRLFGGGPETAAGQVYCDVSDMRRVWGAFDDIAPVYVGWDKWLRDCYDEGSLAWRDYVTGTNYSSPVEGRRRLVYRAYSGRNIYVTRGAHAAGNGAIQGTARELLVDGMLEWMDGPWGRVPVLPVHDQLIGFVPRGQGEAATAYLRKCMTTSVLSSPGFRVEIGVDTDPVFRSWQDSS